MVLLLVQENQQLIIYHKNKHSNKNIKQSIYTKEDKEADTIYNEIDLIMQNRKKKKKKKRNIVTNQATISNKKLKLA